MFGEFNYFLAENISNLQHFWSDLLASDGHVGNNSNVYWMFQRCIQSDVWAASAIIWRHFAANVHSNLSQCCGIMVCEAPQQREKKVKSFPHFKVFFGPKLSKKESTLLYMRCSWNVLWRGINNSNLLFPIYFYQILKISFIWFARV